MTTGTLSFVDATSSANITGGPFDGVCFYMGGDAYRIWGVSEIQARPERYRLPIWVRSNPQHIDPIVDAYACLSAIQRFSVPRGSLIALDSETAVDPGWTIIWVGILNAAGYVVIDYGSQSVVIGNKNPDGYYWGADWTNQPHLHSGDGMTQYISFQNEDVSLALKSLPFWDTKPDTPSTNKPQEEPMQGQLVFDAKGMAMVDLGPAGTYKSIGFSSDWSAEDTPQIILRLAIHRYGPAPAGSFQVMDRQSVPKSGKLVITLPVDADYMSVKIEQGSASVSYGAN